MDPIESSAPAAAPVTAAKTASFGPTVGIVVIIAAILLGAWYMWHQKTEPKEAADVSSLESQGTSTDPAAIQADLSAQSPDNFDSGVDQAFGELDASFDAK